MELPPDTRITESQWRISTRCNGGNCVQVAILDGMVALRDSKNPGHGVLLYSPEEWRRFVASAKAGGYDRPQ
ncbi:DUF397 domain-containing protein [Microbispora sp. NPDC004025]|uniref:DUF397 domain-containing protein n=1 Tax=Microbispora sp. NPDC049633 TaxID=3154355 RepID=UPI00343EF079